MIHRNKVFEAQTTSGFLVGKIEINKFLMTNKMSVFILIKDRAYGIYLF